VVVGLLKKTVVRTVTDGAESTVLYFPTSTSADGCC